jgi:LCP family protein required for cell wall assembly
MVVYGGKPPRPPRGGGKGGRRFRLPRWALWTLGVVGLFLVAAGGAAFWEYQKITGDLGRITHLDKADKQASSKLDPNVPTANEPITALLIGSDHRSNGATGQNGLSDTLMLVRMDPQHHMISMLSIPRDLWVDVPNHGYSKINSAYSEGGDPLTLQTVENLVGFKPNYLINVDFQGFRTLVDTLGGVYINVDQYYYNPPSQSQADGWSEIDIPPGYQLLRGDDALAFSRYRHTDTDFYRQARQQAFLRAFEARASARLKGISFTDIGFLNDLFDALSHSVTIVGPGGHAPSLNTMKTFAATIYEARSHNVSVTMPWEPYTAPDGADAVQLPTGALTTALYQWRHPWTISNAGASLPSAKKKPQRVWKPAVTPSAVTVAVLNGNGRAGAADVAATALGKWGYHATSAGNAATFEYHQTWIFYRAGQAKAATDLAHIFGGTAQTAPMVASISSAAPSAPIVAVIGSPFTGKLAVAAPIQSSGSGGTPSTITPTSEYRPDFLPAARALRFPVFYPTVSQADSTFCPWAPSAYGAGYPASCEGTTTTDVRLYNIAAAGHGVNSMYAVFYDDNSSGGYWGIEETAFTSAPILSTPNAIRKLNGRTYQLYYNGSHIQTIAFIANGAAYWVQNSLLDVLTNPEMIAIARSLKPVG